MKLKLIILFILISSLLFPINMEFSLGGSIATTTDFSHIVVSLDTAKLEDGKRINNGFSASGFLDIGCNFELPNSKGALNSVSLLFETGYYYYMRIRTKYENLDKYKHRFIYHSVILGILPKLNFNNGISFGIGAGIFMPIYSTASQKKNETTLGLGAYSGVSKFKFAEISDMYKVPIMPYIKLNLEKSFYLSESWAFKFGGNIMYNFGMEFDTDKINKDNYYTHKKYNFSSLSIEIFLAVGFGRPK